MAVLLNSVPLEYRGSQGTVFKAPRSDMTEGMAIIKPDGLTEPQFAQDVFEFGWYFTQEIKGRLNRFRGLDFSKNVTITTKGSRNEI